MTAIEDRIRAATQACADTVPPDSVPPLRLPAELGSRRWRSAHRGWNRWARALTPVAAAVAVLLVIIAVVGIGRAVHSTDGRAPAAAAGPVAAGPPISSYVASGQVPRYYVAITSRGGDPSVDPTYAVVAETAGGKILATIQPSVAHGTIVAVTAAADDRTFVLDEERWSANAAGLDDGARTFYEFRLNSSGRPGPLTRLAASVPSGYQLDGLALSPDGSKLAVALEPATNTTPVLAIVKVYVLATGAVRTWTGHGGSIGSAEDARSLSWTSNGQTLAFDWNANSGGTQGGAGGVRLLRVDAADSNLLTAGPPALPAEHPSPQSRPPACQMDLIITPDGSKVVCGAIQIQVLVGGLLNDVTQFREYSTATGQVTPILGYWKFHNVIPNAAAVLWSNASGSVLIGVIPGGGHGGRIGVISGNSFTPLPRAVSAATAEGALNDQAGTW
jgi:hypothetical protein